MATGQVKKIYAAHGIPVLVVGRGGRVQWSDVFEGNPKILKAPIRRCIRLQNGAGMRPYIVGKTATRWTWKRFNIEPGELYFSDEEKEFAEPYRGRVMIEPNVKVATGHDNKAWLWERWQQVARSGDFLQCGPPGTRYLDGVERVVTHTFRQACAVLSVSRAFVGSEGGLHHCAAAVGVPAVVLYSEFISPDITGYQTQRNIRHAGKACGMRLPCRSCRASMEAITVDEVLGELSAVCG